METLVKYQQVLNPTPATCHKRKRKLHCSFRNAALQKLHCNIGLFCSAEVIWTRSCAAANEKLQCNIEKAALQESGAFLPLSCGFQAPTFRQPRLGPAENRAAQSQMCTALETPTKTSAQKYESFAAWILG